MREAGVLPLPQSFQPLHILTLPPSVSLYIYMNIYVSLQMSTLSKVRRRLEDLMAVHFLHLYSHHFYPPLSILLYPSSSCLTGNHSHTLLLSFSTFPFSLPPAFSHSHCIFHRLASSSGGSFARVLQWYTIDELLLPPSLPSYITNF